jgi:hypothetical protein
MFTYNKHKMSEDKIVYSELLNIIKKYKKYGIQNLVVECYIGNIVEPSKKILAHLYIIIDKYVNNNAQNKVFKKETKQWIKDIYVESLPKLIQDAKIYIENKIKSIGILKTIDYSYTKEQLEEYLMYVNVEWDTESKKQLVQIKKDTKKDDEPFKKPKWSDIQHVSVFNGKQIVSYSSLLNNFPVDGIQKDIINKIWSLFQTQEKLLHKEIFYLYIMYLVVPEIKFSDVLKYIESPTFGLPKKIIIIDKNLSINSYITKKITDFINKNKDLPDSFKKKHEYTTCLKIKFRPHFIKNYLQIKKNKNVNDLIVSLNQTLRNKINIISGLKIPHDIENYVMSENGYFYISDEYYDNIQNSISLLIRSYKLNNKTKLIDILYKVMPKTIKSSIIKEIEIYYYD